MKGEYTALKALQATHGYKVLQALWAHQYNKIVEGRRKAGKRGHESSWRYYEGQSEGFEIAITLLERSLLEMEREEVNTEEQKTADELLKEIRGDQQ